MLKISLAFVPFGKALRALQPLVLPCDIPHKPPDAEPFVADGMKKKFAKLAN